MMCSNRQSMSIQNLCFSQSFKSEKGESVNLFEINGLYKCYEKKEEPQVYAVFNINLKIKKGEVLGLVGESGCSRVVVMYLGNIVEIIPNINDEVQHPYTIALHAATLIPDPRKRAKNRVLLKEGEELKIPEKGCVFQNRCLYTQEVCQTVQPTLVSKNDEHYIACHLCHID